MREKCVLEHVPVIREENRVASIRGRFFNRRNTRLSLACAAGLSAFLLTSFLPGVQGVAYATDPITHTVGIGDLRGLLGPIKELKDFGKEVNDLFSGSAAAPIIVQPGVVKPDVVVCNPQVVQVPAKADPNLRCFTPQGLDDELNNRVSQKVVPLQGEVKTANDTRQKAETGLINANAEITKLREATQSGFHFGDVALGAAGAIAILSARKYRRQISGAGRRTFIAACNGIVALNRIIRHTPPGPPPAPGGPGP